MSEKASPSTKFRTNPDRRIRVHIFVLGRVQGVLYRHNTQKMAQKLGLTGQVANLADGRVEAIFEGEKDKIEEMIKWAKRGPFLAKVENMEIIWENYNGEFHGFEIK
ncbi:MAG: acylphosphatase [Patescibacteria group bacterium]